MSWSERRAALAALAALALTAGCGFRPVYGSGGAVGGLDGGVRVAQPTGRAGYYFARALRARLGEPGADAAYEAETSLRFSPQETAITVEDDITRINLVGAATWRLVRRADGEVAAEGRVEAVSAYNTLAAPYATRTAAEDAERRVAEALAERVFLELAAAPRPAA